MDKHLLRPRRIVAAMLISLFASGSVAVLVGFAVADASDALADGSDASANADTFDIGVARQGDRGVYERTTEVTSERVAGRPDDAHIHFHWLQDRLMVNATGAASWTNGLDLRVDEADTWRNTTYRLYSGTLQSLGLEHVHDEERLQSGPEVVPGSPMYEERVNDTYRFLQYTDWPNSAIPCFLAPAFAERDVTVGSRSTMQGPCPNDSGDASLQIVAQAIETESGERILRADLLNPAGERRGEMWFKEGVVYPVHAVLDDGVGTTEYRLTGFEAGTELRRGARTAPEGPDRPDLVFVDRPRWGLDDAGVDHPFPLSQAFQHARDDPSHPDLREFLAEHPDAYVAIAYHAEFLVDDRRSQRWTFLVTDGQASHTTMISQDRLGPAAPDLPLQAEFTTQYRYGDAEAKIFSDVAGFLPPDQVPEHMPSVVSLMAAWQAHASEPYAQSGANTWSFQIARDGDGPGGTPGLYLSVGYGRYTGDDASFLLPGSTSQWNHSTLAWYDDLSRVSRLDERVSESVRQAPGTAPAKRESSQDDPPAALTPTRSTWVLPGSERAAAIGFGGLLLGFLYWLWPALKSGVAGLFTRLRRDELLEHPMRAAIAQQVEAQPGIHFQELVRALGRSDSVVEHHLKKLVDGGRIVVHRAGGHACCFVAGQVDRRAMAAAAYTKSPLARGILEAAKAEPGVRAAELRQRLGVGASGFHYHVDRLRKAGLLETRRDGGGIRLRVPGPAAEA